MWKYKIKQFLKKTKIYGTLPHMWGLFIITVLALFTCLLSIAYIEKSTFLSSLFANIFAGLLTGVIICLVTTIKSVSLYRTESKIRWLEDLHNECLEFISMYRKIFFLKEDELKNNEDYYNYIYDTLCRGNGISQMISQGRFKESLPFNPYKYCQKEFSFDAVEVMKNNNDLREKLIASDVSQLSKIRIKELFNTMECQIFRLNGDIIKKLDTLKAKKKAINISIG